MKNYYEPLKKATASFSDPFINESLSLIFDTIQKQILPFNNPLLNGIFF